MLGGSSGAKAKAKPHVDATGLSEGAHKDMIVWSCRKEAVMDAWQTPPNVPLTFGLAASGDNGPAAQVRIPMIQSM